MKKQLIIVAICIGLLPLALKAQTTTTNGPELDLNETASAYVLDDNDDFMLFFSQKKSWSYDDVVITKYNKQTMGITEQAVDDDYEGRFVFLTDDNTVANVVRFVENKKTMMLEYQKASFPLDVKVPKKLVFTPFFSVPLKNKKESYYTRACFNADKSKFAIVSATNSGRSVDVKTPFHAKLMGTLVYNEEELPDHVVFGFYRGIGLYVNGAGSVPMEGGMSGSSKENFLITAAEHPERLQFTTEQDF